LKTLKTGGYEPCEAFHIQTIPFHCILDSGNTVTHLMWLFHW